MTGPKEEQQGDNVSRLNAILEFNTLPIHWAAQHLCCEDFGAVATASDSISLMPRTTVGGFRVHKGTAEECLSQLGSFGISKETIPLNPTFEPQLIKHLNWYRHCQLLDSSDALGWQGSSTDRAMALVKHPKPNDVLFGRNRQSTKNNGSKRLRSLTDQFSDEYERGHRVTKRQLIQRVVDEIRSSGGRFLSLIEGTEENARWEEVPIENVETKIGQMFRNSRRYLAKKPSAADEVPAPRIVHEPDMRDVLLGRKAGNGGNRLVRELVVKLSPQYDAGTRNQKAELANAVFNEVKITGGKFLLQIHAEEWEEVSDDIARSKISKYFRNLRRPKDRR